MNSKTTKNPNLIYVARDQDEQLCFYEKKPFRTEDEEDTAGVWDTDDDAGIICAGNNKDFSMFDDLKWENEPWVLAVVMRPS